MWCAGSPVANVDGVVIKESNEILEAFFFFAQAFRWQMWTEW